MGQKRLVCLCLVCAATALIPLSLARQIALAQVWKEDMLNHECQPLHENDDNLLLSTGVSDAANCPYTVPETVLCEASSGSACSGTVWTSWFDGLCKPVEYCLSRCSEMDTDFPSGIIKEHIEYTYECYENGNPPDGETYPCSCGAYVSDPQPQDPNPQEVWDCADFT